MKKNKFVSIAAVLSSTFSLFISSPASSKTIQEIMGQSDCLACHKVDEKLIGPSFKDISLKYKGDSKATDTLSSAIKNGSSGNWGDMVMPPHADIDASILSEMVSMILSMSGQIHKAEKTDAAPAVKPIFIPSAVEIEKGKALFQGTKRFASGGPSCMSCHNVVSDSMLGGATFAKDLTDAHSRLDRSGIVSVINALPFPAMKTAYRDRKMTSDEAEALASFLYHVDKNKIYNQDREYGLGLLLSGISGALFLFIFFGMISIRNKRRSVNDQLFKRQGNHLDRLN